MAKEKDAKSSSLSSLAVIASFLGEALRPKLGSLLKVDVQTPAPADEGPGPIPASSSPIFVDHECSNCNLGGKVVDYFSTIGDLHL